MDSDEKNTILQSESCKSSSLPPVYLLCSHLLCDTFDSHYCHGVPGVLKISSWEWFY